MDMKKPPKEGGWKLKGGQRGSRTLDTRIFSPLLYQLSYLAVYVVLTCSSITISNLKRESNENLKKFGASASIRTPHAPLTNRCNGPQIKAAN